MLRITIELVPGGNEDRKKVIATGTITNLGTSGPSVGNYFVDLRDKAGRLWRHGTIFGFPRRKLLAWDLLCRALTALIGDRNKIG
jgi:hypothetical protein